ncbi:hypothetical protein TWF281_009423 [Arthrobotrys megalospora]
MYTPISSYSYISLLLLFFELTTSIYCNPEEFKTYPVKKKDLKPPIPDVDYEVDTFGARANRTIWIDQKIIAVLHKPELFNREGMVPFGIGGERKGLIVAWNTDAKSKTHSINALVDTKETLYWFANEFKMAKNRAFPQFMQWRFVPITSLHRNSPETLIKTDVPRELQYFVTNGYIVRYKDGKDLDGRNIFARSKYGMAASEWGDDLNVVPEAGDWMLLDQARNDINGGGVDPAALVGGYEGLSYANMSAPYSFPPDEEVIVNGTSNIMIESSSSDIRIYATINI